MHFRQILLSPSLALGLPLQVCSTLPHPLLALQPALLLRLHGCHGFVDEGVVGTAFEQLVQFFGGDVGVAGVEVIDGRVDGLGEEAFVGGAARSVRVSWPQSQGSGPGICG